MLRNLKVRTRLLVVLVPLGALIVAGVGFEVNDRLARADRLDGAGDLLELARAESLFAAAAAEEAERAEAATDDESAFDSFSKSATETNDRWDHLREASTLVAGNDGRLDDSLSNLNEAFTEVVELRSDVADGTAAAATVSEGYRDLGAVLDETETAMLANAENPAAADALVHVVEGQPEAETFTTAADVLATEADDARAVARNFIIGAVLALGLAAIATFLVLRSIIRPLRTLGDRADDLATRRLPSLVERMRDPSADGEAPEIESMAIDSDDEIGRLSRSINSIADVTVSVAEEQADLLRRGIGDMFVNLARRNQSLLEKQIAFIDELERTEEDPEQLESLFRLDHLATRMRRNADSLLVLSGSDSSRRQGRDISIVDVVRVAAGEVEHFQRLRLREIDDAVLSATVAVDVAHLLSELFENATQFSPPETDVEVWGRLQPDGSYGIEVHDSGIGMTEEQLGEANTILSTPPLLGLSMSRTLGLTVVSRLSERSGAQVRLRSSDHGVVAAIALPAPVIAVPVATPTPPTTPVSPASPVTEHRPPVAVPDRQEPDPVDWRKVLAEDLAHVPSSNAGDVEAPRSPAPAPAQQAPSSSAAGSAPPVRPTAFRDLAEVDRSRANDAARLPTRVRSAPKRETPKVENPLTPTKRSPEEVRRLLSRYRSGLEKGRGTTDDEGR